MGFLIGWPHVYLKLSYYGRREEQIWEDHFQSATPCSPSPDSLPSASSHVHRWLFLPSALGGKIKLSLISISLLHYFPPLILYSYMK